MNHQISNVIPRFLRENKGDEGEGESTADADRGEDDGGLDDGAIQFGEVEHDDDGVRVVDEGAFDRNGEREDIGEKAVIENHALTRVIRLVDFIFQLSSGGAFHEGLGQLGEWRICLRSILDICFTTGHFRWQEIFLSSVAGATARREGSSIDGSNFCCEPRIRFLALARSRDESVAVDDEKAG